jgi:hypothetical protein
MRLYEVHNASVTGVSSSTYHEVTFQRQREQLPIEVVRLMIQHVSGSATSFVFSMGVTNSYATTDISCKYLSSSVNTVSGGGTGILDVTDISAYMVTNTEGKLYLKFSPNSGSNNEFKYSIMFFGYQ